MSDQSTLSYCERLVYALDVRIHDQPRRIATRRARWAGGRWQDATTGAPIRWPVERWRQIAYDPRDPTQRCDDIATWQPTGNRALLMAAAIQADWPESLDWDRVAARATFCDARDRAKGVSNGIGADTTPSSTKATEKRRNARKRR